MRSTTTLFLPTMLVITGFLTPVDTAQAQALDAGLFTRIELRQCAAGTIEDPRPVCSGDNPTLTNIGDFDLAQDGVSAVELKSPRLAHQSAANVGYVGEGRAPAISVYSYSNSGLRLNASAFGFQRYEFLEDGELQVSATLTYSQTGIISPQASRNPRGTLAGGITVFQMENDEFLPQNCPRWVAGGADYSIPGSGIHFLFCLLFDDFVGMQNFQNFEFNPDPVEIANGSLTQNFSIAAQQGDVWFLTADMFAHANNGGFADSRTTLRIDIQNPEIVQASFDAESFEPAPPLTVSANIDVRPYRRDNKVWLGRWGLVPVAVLGSESFDALQVDPASVRLGENEAPPLRWYLRTRDVNRDGFMDVTFLFRSRKTGIQCGDTEVGMSGSSYEGVPFIGYDSILTAGCD